MAPVLEKLKWTEIEILAFVPYLEELDSRKENRRTFQVRIIPLLWEKAWKMT